MKKLILLLIIIYLINGCSVPSVALQNISGNTPSTPSITSSTDSGLALTGIDLYMKCFNEGKYDIYNLKIGDPIQNAIDEFGQGEKGYYGLGGTCYTYKDAVVAFAEGTESFENRVEIFDIIREGITAYGITTGKSTIEDVIKILGEPDHTGHYTYEMTKPWKIHMMSANSIVFLVIIIKTRVYGVTLNFSLKITN